jgi:hypothetical protein
MISGVEQAQDLCVSGQLYRRAAALVADAALSLWLSAQLYRRADAGLPMPRLMF